MGQNERIRTEDVVEILDVKILTVQGHPDLGVIPRENYDSVLTKIGLQSLTPAQKEAFDNTLTTPSALNPVVLKNDLDTYVPQADLGEIRDSVDTFSLLPGSYAKTGDTTNGSTTLANVSTLTNLLVGQLITGTGIPANTTLVEFLTGNNLKMSQAATATATGVALTFSPVLGELRGVIADGIIYRWNGTAWMPFIKTGTLDHTELTNQNGDSNFLHLTLAEKTSVISQSHTHSNQSILDQILDAGSGQIITALERSNLPTTSQKAALVGTSGVPSGTNPYVTNLDPRLNTQRNPYVTIGPPGSLATFQGVDFRPFEDALLAISVGSASAVKAIEVLPGFYTIGGVVLKWDTQSSSVLIENFTPGTATLSFQTFEAGIQALLPGTGQLIVRGFTFELNDLGTSGILTRRPNSVIEDCIFQPGPTTSLNQVGVILDAVNCVVRRCLFRGELAKGIEVRGANCRVEECKFDFVNPLNPGVDVFSTGTQAFINSCHFINARLNVQLGAANTQITGNSFATTTAIVTAGSNTRILENLPQEVNQPYIGRIRTVGGPTSYADFRGNDHTPFIAALADPNVTEIEVLEGTYQFGTTVVIPSGKALRGVTNGNASVVLQSVTSGLTLLTMASSSRLENLQITGINAPLVNGSSLSGTHLKNCTFTLTTTDSVDDYGVSLSSIVDLLIEGCTFTGVRGLRLNNSVRSRLYRNIFSTSVDTVTTTGTNSVDHIKDNYFTTSPAPVLTGTNLIVEGNHFLGTVPSKATTTGSVWQSNWPHPEANNDSGVDTLDVSLGSYLEPTNLGAVRSTIVGTGSIAFDASTVGSAATFPIQLDGHLNRTLGFSATIYWTAGATSGDVVWRITSVFRDRVTGLLGTSVSKAVTATRSFSSPNDENTASLTWTNLDYGLPGGVAPTHVSVIVERVGNSLADTMAGDAHLLEVELSLPRD